MQDAGMTPDDEESLRKMLNSNALFAQLLKALGVDPPVKISPTTGKEVYAFAKTDEELVALLAHEDPRVATAVAARLSAKTSIEETRTETLLDYAGRGAFPIALRYYGANTGRWSAESSAKVNMQNIPRASPIKEAIRAPAGQMLCGADLSNIELRLGLWLAMQDDRVQMLAQGVDLYKDFATEVFSVAYADVTKTQRQVGKVANLSLIFGTGAAKLRDSLRIIGGVSMAADRVRPIVDLYRVRYAQVVAAWKEGEQALVAMAAGQRMPLFRGGICTVEGADGIRLPSGLHLHFPNLRRVARESDGKPEWVFDSKYGPERVYGARVYQACIAEGTEVLTNRGWVSLEMVRLTDLVHDGVEFVSHGGVIYKGFQACTTIDGVFMTPDHKVLTDDGWQTASQNPRPYRPDLRHVDGAESCAQRRPKTLVALSMSVRSAVHKRWCGSYESAQSRPNLKLWMRDQTTYKHREHQAWNESSLGLRGVGHDAPAVCAPHATRVETLWRAGYSRVRALAEFVFEFLGRHGGCVPSGIALGPHRQQRRLHPRELPMGYPSRKFYEQAHYRAAGGRGGLKQSDGDRSHHNLLPFSPWLAGGTVGSEAAPFKQVFDILNCGARQRFVVRGAQGPFVVHNCTQSIARCIIAEGMLRVHKRYPVRLMIHDSAYWLAPEQEAEAALQFGIEALTAPVSYCPGLPLAAEGAFGRSLADC